MSLFRRLRILIVVVVFALFVGGFLLYKMKLPKPQTVSAAGHVDPDFSLLDQSDQPFHLASQRGHRVLLIFYRGYW